MVDSNRVPIATGVTAIATPIRGSNYFLEGTVDPLTGIRTITYTFNHNGRTDRVTDGCELTDPQKAAQLDAFRHIERISRGRIRFVPLARGVAPERANIRIMQGGVPAGALATTTSADGPLGRAQHRNIVFDLSQTRGRTAAQLIADFAPGTYNWGAFQHETGHAIGLEHTGAHSALTEEEGRRLAQDPAYDTDGTVMSYRQRSRRYGFRDYDVAAIRYLYGVGTAAAGIEQFNANSLMHTTILHSPNVSIMLTNADQGNLTVNLDTMSAVGRTFHGSRIDGRLNNRDISASIASASTTGPRAGRAAVTGTNVTSIVLDPNSRVTLNATTTANLVVTGGAMADTITIQGGNNIVTGGAGGDNFVFNEYSGTNNVITDFNAAEDNLKFAAGSSIRTGVVELRQRTADFAWNGGTHSGTEMIIRNGAGGPVVSSTFLINATPAQIRANLLRNGVTAGISTVPGPSVVTPPPAIAPRAVVPAHGSAAPPPGGPVTPPGGPVTPPGGPVTPPGGPVTPPGGTNPASPDDGPGMAGIIGAIVMGGGALLVGGATGLGTLPVLVIAVIAALLGGFGGRALASNRTGTGTAPGSGLPGGTSATGGTPYQTIEMIGGTRYRLNGERNVYQFAVRSITPVNAAGNPTGRTVEFRAPHVVPLRGDHPHPVDLQHLINASRDPIQVKAMIAPTGAGGVRLPYTAVDTPPDQFTPGHGSAGGTPPTPTLTP